MGSTSWKTPIAVLEQTQLLVSSNVNVLLMSRDDSLTRKNVTLASHVGISGNLDNVSFNFDTQPREMEPSLELNAAEIREVTIFMIAKLILEEAIDYPTASTIRNETGSTQTKSALQRIYEAILDRIDSQPEAQRSLAWRLLGWIVHAKRPLVLQEIVSAFSVEGRSDIVDPNSVLESCNRLIVVDAIAYELHLAHRSLYSVLAERIHEKDANMDLERTCLRYLLMEALAGP
ncbi:hypothetical protein BJX70DRAFT_395387 [Aspergillus crustosus]